MTGYEVIKKFEELSSPEYAADWDNVGLLVGRRDKEIKVIYIALDATDEVIQRAIDVNADMLLTHHPMIFSSLKKVSAEHFIGRRVLRLARHDIAYYAMHTNFDVMGMADAAADEIQLKNREVLEVTYEDDISKEGFGRIGKLQRIMSLRECALYVKERFGIDSVKVFGDLDTNIEKAAICPGSGRSMIEEAIERGADVFITGDIDHHSGIDAIARGLNIIDAGHFGIEKIFVPYMEEFINREMPGIKVYTREPLSPFTVL